MEEQDPVPTPRMHWTRIVLGRGHPIIIITVLAAVGAVICWFSLQNISLLTQTPTRYVMTLEVNTEGCDRTLSLYGDIGSVDASFLRFLFVDEDERPVFRGECRLRSIVLRTNQELQPARLYDGSLELIGILGADPSVSEQEDGDVGLEPSDDALETYRVTIVDGDLRAFVRPDSTGPGPSFSMGAKDPTQQADYRLTKVQYEVAFDQWQPRQLHFVFAVPENVRTYFELIGYQTDARVPESQDRPAIADGSGLTYRDLDMAVSFRTDEVLLVRGLMSDSGDAQSVDGYLRFGIENSDAQSKRESGNVRFSAILGIGIALIVEAFVILLALGIRALATRLGVSGKPVAPAD